MGQFQGIIPAEISSWFPSGNSGDRGSFYVNISACGICGDISAWKFPLCFPQKFQNAIQWHRKGPSYVKISQWWFDVILWWIKMFRGLGKLPSNFNPDLKISLNFHVLVSLTTQISAWIPSTNNHNPRGLPQNPRDFAHWAQSFFICLLSSVLSFKSIVVMFNGK